MEIGQSQVVETILAKKFMSAGQATGALTPMALDNGSQKNGKAVGHTDTQVDGQRRGGNKPAVEVGPGDGALLGQKIKI